LLKSGQAIPRKLDLPKKRERGTEKDWHQEVQKKNVEKNRGNPLTPKSYSNRFKVAKRVKKVKGGHGAKPRSGVGIGANCLN